MLSQRFSYQYRAWKLFLYLTQKISPCCGKRKRQIQIVGSGLSRDLDICRTRGSRLQILPTFDILGGGGVHILPK